MSSQDVHVRRGYPATYAIILIVSIVELIITGVLVGTYNRHHNPPSGSTQDRVRFLLFASIWQILLGTLYLVGTFFFSSLVFFSLIGNIVFFVISWVFWLVGTAAITGNLKGNACDIPSIHNHCNQLTATEAFGWINVVLLLFALIVSIVLGFGSGSRGGLTSAVLQN